MSITRSVARSNGYQLSGVSQDCAWVDGINGTKIGAGEPTPIFVPN